MATHYQRALIGDESLTPTSSAGLTFPFGDRAPQPGELLTVAPGIRWWRVPMSGPLKHVNGLILDDGDGLLAIDTGTASPRSTEAWNAILDGPLAGQRITRILCTHMHPDHIGLAGWLARRFDDAPILMTRTEWLMARMLSSDSRDEVPPEQIAFWRACGWSPEQIASAEKGGFARFGKMIARLPLGFTRIRDGETLSIGGSDWEVVVGSGHSPEHACLLDRERRILIAGDQVLPRISSNVSLHVNEPGADPLGEWLDSIARFRLLPDDLLVLPGHGDPFHGLHARLDALATEHRDRLDTLAAHIETPRRAADCFPQLFRRPIGPDVIGMATGEALAHLRHLEATGRARREDRDGVWWYSRA
ncbi:MBL fold metallo-hydrolase [Sphingomonas sp. Leaf412]|uniref:MBL fold metallo-hydrolase n=1 Tax=Sphingomonas sp. Leaf412 TaxID=1736370 RepID=UPI0006FFD119|nr:MBL fold metallo-hydrolase [Sphingomonas sp. Leaf412]KQT34814.1 MBL fold metallo-hydrolase [Sphingomonas sp. Leaf412]